ncbi:ATP-grasp domain-containing protein [Patescibacteria group bacterium]|nr:ATP-grasp domain-containing protein [Patescibacteria group bacterium]
MSRIGVLRGGVGEEHDVSLKTGLAVLRKLENTHAAVDVFIDRRGVWHVRGVPMPPQRALAGIDLAFNALHGAYGEDGGVQRELERIGVRYTGPEPMPASLAMNKVVSKQLMAAQGVLVPRHVLVGVTPNLERRALEIWRSFPQPSVVKPLASGSSVGVTLVKTFEQFLDALKNAFQYAKDVVVEEYVRGREATVGVIDRFRGQQVYVLPPVEIILPVTSEIFDWQAKYGGNAVIRVPSGFTRQEVLALESAARAVHATLGLRHYSRSDFIMTPRGPYFLEVNALPGLTETSLVPRSLEAVGSSMDELVAHVISLALEKK